MLIFRNTNYILCFYISYLLSLIVTKVKIAYYKFKQHESLVLLNRKNIIFFETFKHLPNKKQKKKINKQKI